MDALLSIKKSVIFYYKVLEHVFVLFVHEFFNALV